jgi:hypothetical protein
MQEGPFYDERDYEDDSPYVPEFDIYDLDEEPEMLRLAI